MSTKNIKAVLTVAKKLMMEPTIPNAPKMREKTKLSRLNKSRKGKNKSSKKLEMKLDIRTNPF